MVAQLNMASTITAPVSASGSVRRPGEEAGAAQSCAEPPQKGTEPKLSQIPPAVWLKPDWEGRGMGKLGDGVEPPRAG